MTARGADAPICALYDRDIEAWICSSVMRCLHRSDTRSCEPCWSLKSPKAMRPAAARLSTCDSLTSEYTLPSARGARRIRVPTGDPVHDAIQIAALAMNDFPSVSGTGSNGHNSASTGYSVESQEVLAAA